MCVELPAVKRKLYFLVFSEQFLVYSWLHFPKAARLGVQQLLKEAITQVVV